MSSEIAARVKRIVAEELHVKPEELKDDATFDDFTVDSLTRIEIVLRLEEEFHVDVPKDDATELNDVKGAIAFVESLVKSKAA